MKRIIDVDKKLVCEGFVRNFTEEERDILINAIRNSIPYEEKSQGDLVSREWLKDAFDNLCCHNCKICRNFRNEDSFYKCALIENAPPVKPKQGELNELTYDKGFITAMKLYARPKGKWKKVKEERCAVDISGEIATRYKCSECGRTITILPSKLADYPFCHCGADMRKGDTE